MHRNAPKRIDHMMLLRFFVGAATIAAFGASGCSPAGVAVTAGAKAGSTVAQERSVGDAVSDAGIDAEIHYLWAKHNLALFRKLSSAIVEGRVLLTGSVRYPQTRIDAVRLAWQADGVKEVINEIQVDDESGLVDRARDIWIITTLRSRLLFDGQIKSVNYNLDAVNGVVYLMGIAQDEAELERITSHARDIRHVRRIVSHVRLKDEPPGTSS